MECPPRPAMPESIEASRSHVKFSILRTLPPHDPPDSDGSGRISGPEPPRPPVLSPHPDAAPLLAGSRAAPYSLPSRFASRFSDLRAIAVHQPLLDVRAHSGRGLLPVPGRIATTDPWSLRPPTCAEPAAPGPASPLDLAGPLDRGLGPGPTRSWSLPCRCLRSRFTSLLSSNRPADRFRHLHAGQLGRRADVRRNRWLVTASASDRPPALTGTSRTALTRQTGVLPPADHAAADHDRSLRPRAHGPDITSPLQSGRNRRPQFCVGPSTRVAAGRDIRASRIQPGQVTRSGVPRLGWTEGRTTLSEGVFITSKFPRCRPPVVRACSPP